MAHESSKTALTYSHYAFDEILFNLTIELTKLKVFKSNKLAEEKIIQKAAKKSRQKQHWHQSLQHQKFPTPFSTQKYGGSQEIHTEAAERGDCVLMTVQY